MIISKGKTTTIVAALLIILAMAISLLTMPADNQYATAQDTKKSYAFIGATPNPVGVNQETLLHIGITQQKQSEADIGWFDLSVTIERPDGETDTLDGITTDSTGGTGRIYIPDIEGTYYVQTHFPAQWYNYSDYWGGETSTFYEASDSEVLELVVQADPIPYYPVVPLPTEYWTRPINAQLREWSSVSQSFFGSIPLQGVFVPGHDEAPDSGHVLWTKPFTTGGLAGGETYGEHAFECGDAYQGKYSSPGIIAGMLIYTHSTGVRPLVYTAVDVRTGEVVWENTFLDNRSISMLQLFYWDSYNYHGVYSYIWVTVGSDWYAFDPFDCSHRITMTNVPSGTTIIGENGNIYRYTVDLNNGWMALWNWSARISMEGNFRGTGQNTYNCSGTSSSVTRAWAWNITIPKGLPGSVGKVGLGDRVVGATMNQERIITWGFSLEEGNEGDLLFNKTWTAPDEWAEGDIQVGGSFGAGWGASSLEDKVATIWLKETREHYGFSLETGEYLWGPTPSEHYLGIYETWEVIAYGRLYTHGMKGMIDCYNATTGELLWTYKSVDPLAEILWSNNWPIRIEFITDGKLYCRHSEHSPVDPKPRGAPFICINATTGEEIWRLTGLRGSDWGGHATIGDSVVVTQNTYDQQVWAVGKGPSATSVTAGPEVSAHGSTVLVKGMVTDVSPGTNDLAITMRFPNGVPAVSDEDMDEWMQHVYMQFARPADVTGVEVVVSVLDPNNNFYEVGRAISDSSGMFQLPFVPEVPGEYTVIASFEGSNSYYGSSAETALYMEEAPQPTPCPTPTPEPMTDFYVTSFGAGMIIAIVVVGLLLFLMLRKR